MRDTSDRIRVRCHRCGHVMSAVESSYAIGVRLPCSQCGAGNCVSQGTAVVEAWPVPDGQVSVASVATRWHLAEARVREAVIDGWLCYTAEGHLSAADVAAVESMSFVCRWQQRAAAGEALTPVLRNYVNESEAARSLDTEGEYA
jgi:hypothetical protein